MPRSAAPRSRGKAVPSVYVLDHHFGFVLRQVSQRHTAIFADRIGCNLTPTQWAALSKLNETGACSQNRLGRQTAMDVATIKGVIDRLSARGLTETAPDPDDGRRLQIRLTRAGRILVEKTIPAAVQITEQTLAPLTIHERKTLNAILAKLL